MFTIHTPLPDIIGRRCVKLLCQQFWHSGVLATDVNAIIMNLEDGSWHKFFFDSSVLFWKQAQLSPAFDTLITDEFHYPSVDLCARFPLCGLTVEQVSPLDCGNHVSELRIRFAGGHVLVLREVADDMKITHKIFPAV